MPRGGRQPGAVLRQYYAELTSSPHLPMRTSSTLSQKPKGPEAYRNINQPELGLVNHKPNSDWEFQVASKVQACLDEMQVQWTSLDIVLIGKVGASSNIERLSSLSTANTPVARPLGASMVSKTLVSLTFTTTNDSRISSWTPCRNSRSLVIRSAGPQLLPPQAVLSSDPTAGVRHPRTHSGSTSLPSPRCLPAKHDVERQVRTQENKPASFQRPPPQRQDPDSVCIFFVNTPLGAGSLPRRCIPTPRAAPPSSSLRIIIS